VMHDRTKTVDHNDTTTIKNDKTVTVHGLHKETITKDMTVKVTAGKQDTTVNKDIAITSEDGEITLSSPKMIKLAVGKSTIVMTEDRIVINSPKVDLNP